MVVRIKNKEYPSRLTLGAMVRFKENTGKDVSEIGSDIADVARFMHCCVTSACRADDVEFDIIAVR